MFALTHAAGDKKLLLEAIACIDCAIWDLTGKALGKSVRELLGGLHRPAAGHFHRRLLRGRQNARRHRARIEAYRDAGMAGCKFKVGGLSPEEDAARVAVARKAAATTSFCVSMPTAAGRRKTRSASRGWSSRSRSAGSRNPATGTTTRRRWRACARVPPSR